MFTQSSPNTNFDNKIKITQRKKLKNENFFSFSLNLIENQKQKNDYNVNLYLATFITEIYFLNENSKNLEEESNFSLSKSKQINKLNDILFEQDKRVNIFPLETEVSFAEFMKKETINIKREQINEKEEMKEKEKENPSFSETLDDSESKFNNYELLKNKFLPKKSKSTKNSLFIKKPSLMKSSFYQNFERKNSKNIKNNNNKNKNIVSLSNRINSNTNYSTFIQQREQNNKIKSPQNTLSKKVLFSSSLTNLSSIASTRTSKTNQTIEKQIQKIVIDIRNLK